LPRADPVRTFETPSGFPAAASGGSRGPRARRAGLEVVMVLVDPGAQSAPTGRETGAWARARHRASDAELAGPAAAPTPGSIPGPESPVRAWLASIHARHAANSGGTVARYIPELAVADPAWFGVALATVDGSVHAVGDADVPFTIQSISKPLTYGLVLDELGDAIVRERIGVEPTGDAFNAITLDPATGRPLNPMVNAGAVAAAGLFGAGRPKTPGGRADPFEELLAAFGRFAGRPLALDTRVYESERDTGHRNRAIAQLLRSTGAVDGDPDAAVDLYFRQCSIAVTARDLAAMAATLANGGRHPSTGDQVLGPATTRSVLSVMATCGMYDGAGEWMFSVGLPAKSGVAGGLIAVLPGRLGIGIFSPPLDDHGNSVRGVALCRDLSADLDLHLVAVRGSEASPVRARYTVAEIGSKRRRDPADRACLAERGRGSIILELQGPLAILAVDRLAAELIRADPPPVHVVLDLRRVTAVEPSSHRLFAHLVHTLRTSGAQVLVSGGHGLSGALVAIDAALGELGEDPVETVAELDLAIEAVEEHLLATVAAELAATSDVPDGSDAGEIEAMPLAGHALLGGLDARQLDRVAGLLGVRRIESGGRIVTAGDPATELFLVAAGRLSVSIATADGRRRLSTLGPGMMFGEGALLGSARRSADVDADDAVVCHVLAIADFEELVRDDPAIGAVILGNLARIVGDTAQRLTRELAILAG
jgi:glutaminase